MFLPKPEFNAIALFYTETGEWGLKNRSDTLSIRQKDRNLRLDKIATGFLTFVMLIFGSSHGSEYRVELCYLGCPAGASPDSDIILRPIYALAYNTQYKSADWVVYKVTADSIGIASSLSRDTVPDNYISGTLDSADFADLEGTGLVRSQYVPMVNFAGTPYWSDINYATNVVARSSALNQGAWYGLDWAIRNLVNKEEAVFVITGPVYMSAPVVARLNTPKLHRVPDAFFKIVVTESGLATAFLHGQDIPVHVHHCDLRVPIAELEKLTNLDFLPEAGSRQFDPLDSGLGCS